MVVSGELSNGGGGGELDGRQGIHEQMSDEGEKVK